VNRKTRRKKTGESQDKLDQVLEDLNDMQSQVLELQKSRREASRQIREQLERIEELQTQLNGAIGNGEDCPLIDLTNRTTGMEQKTKELHEMQVSLAAVIEADRANSHESLDSVQVTLKQVNEVFDGCQDANRTQFKTLNDKRRRDRRNNKLAFGVLASFAVALFGLIWSLLGSANNTEIDRLAKIAQRYEETEKRQSEELLDFQKASYGITSISAVLDQSLIQRVYDDFEIMVESPPSSSRLQSEARTIARAKANHEMLRKLKGSFLDEKYDIDGLLATNHALQVFHETVGLTPPGRLFRIEQSELNAALQQFARVSTRDLICLGEMQPRFEAFFQYAEGVVLLLKSRKTDDVLLQKAISNFIKVDPKFHDLHVRACVNLAICNKQLFKLTAESDTTVQSRLRIETLRWCRIAAMHAELGNEKSLALNTHADALIFFAGVEKEEEAKKSMLVEASKVLSDAELLTNCNCVVHLTHAECRSELAGLEGTDNLSPKDARSLADEILRLVRKSRVNGFDFEGVDLDDVLVDSPSLRQLEILIPDTWDNELEFALFGS